MALVLGSRAYLEPLDICGDINSASSYAVKGNDMSKVLMIVVLKLVCLLTLAGGDHKYFPATDIRNKVG